MMAVLLQQLKKLNELARNGGYVCAEYLGQTEVLVGKVEPQTSIEIIDGRWNPDVINGVERTAKLKTIQLKNTQKLSPTQSAPIMAGRPQQGTICQWHKCGEAIKHIVNEEPPEEIGVEDLLPSQQEIIAYEFLRHRSVMGLPRIHHLLMPIGRTLRDLDILALNEKGERTCVQVTYYKPERKGAINKTKSLKKYQDESSYLILACNAESSYQKDGIYVISLREALNWFKNSALSDAWFSSHFPQ